MRPQVIGVLAAMAIVLAACGGASSTDSSTGEPSATQDPMNLGEPTSPLEDGSTVTLDDSGRMFFATAGSRIQLQLSSDWLWNEPTITSPHRLVAISFVADPGYLAWDIVLAEPGDVTIEAAGVAMCDGCDDRDFAVTIAARNE